MYPYTAVHMVAWYGRLKNSFVYVTTKKVLKHWLISGAKDKNM